MNEFLKWLLAKVWKNFGEVDTYLYRSGQMGKWMLSRTVRKYKIKYIIAMNMDGSNEAEKDEIEFCRKEGIDTFHCNLSAGAPNDPIVVRDIVAIIERNREKGINTLVHCAGGRDRTGGIVGCWMMSSKVFSRREEPLTAWMEQCARHKIPAEGWSKEAVEWYLKRKV